MPSGRLPLTPLQHGMLFHALREPESGLYLEQLSCRLEGPLDHAALAAAWAHLVERHDALRTSFEWRRSAEPVQMIHRQAQMPLDVVDWSYLDDARQQAALEALCREECRRPFDLTVPPLMRATVARLGPRSHALVWTHHHLILDGWSVGIVVRDLVAAYVALAEGRAPALDRPRSFEPFVHWLRRRDPATAASFWQEYLRGFETPTLVPRDARGGGDAPGFDQISCALSDAECRDLRAFVASVGVTEFTAVAAAWSLALAAVTGESDVLFGTTVSGRPCSIPGIESMVGLFINTIPFRARVASNQRAGDWLRVLEERKRAATDDKAYAALPAILKTLRAESGAAESGPFNTLLVFENYPLPTSLEVSAELALRDIRCLERTNFDLTLAVVPSRRLECTLSFDPRRHSRPAVQRLLQMLRSAVLKLAARDAGARLVGDLLEADGAGRRQALVEYARGPRPRRPAGAGEERIEDIIWARCEEEPHAIALAAADEHWSYGYLRAQARAMAARLATMGVGPDDPVCVCVRRGPWLVAAALAVMEAGGCYVPLDVEWPDERKRALAADAGAKAVIVDEDAETQAWVRAPIGIARVGRTAARDTAVSDRLPAAAAKRFGGRGLAYVIYTSGSTGAPKGVMVEHAGVVNRLWWMQRAYPIGPGDRVLQKTPATFDVSVWELFWPLMVGARLVFAAPGGHRDARYIADELRRRRIGTVHFVPSMLQALLDGPGLAACRTRTSSSLRRVICSGEALTGALAARFWSSARAAGMRAGDDGLRLENLYGPTEASVDVSSWRADPPSDDDQTSAGAGTSLPIGRPIDDMRLYVLDRTGRVLPPGAIGELCIGGIGLARGYAGRPALTADRFVPDPFGAAGGRLYRTGDLVRWRPDGALDFLGRNDHQVKVRGVRIEPGEVEAVIAAQPNVGVAAVAAHPAPGGVRLVGYVVRRDTSRPWAVDRELIFDALRRRLPGALVPSMLVEWQGDLPLTASGKLDRRALPPPDADAQAPPADAWREATPLSPIEETIAEIWSDVLGLPHGRLRPEDDFLRLGGDSLSSLSVVGRMSACFHVEVPLATLWDAPTLRAAAQRVSELLAAAGAPRAVSLPRVEGSGSAPLSSAQQRLWYAHQLNPRGTQHNVSCAVWLNGPLDQAALASSLDRLLARHDVLRTEFFEDGGEPRQRVSDVVSMELRTADVSGPDAETRCAHAALEWIQRPFDLRRAPLVRALVIRCAPDRHALVLALHHIACDGWSSRILVRDLCAIYEALAEGREPQLRETSARYVDFASWQHAQRGEAAARERLRWWIDRLQPALADGAPGLAATAAAAASPSAGLVSRTLPPDLTKRLRSLRHAHGVTSFMTMLAAFDVLMHDVTGVATVRVGTDVTDRAQAETWDVVGFFINQLVLETSLEGDPSFTELLARVRQTCVDAFAHQDVPYDALVRALRRGMRHTRALFRVKLVQQASPPLAFDVGPLRVRPLEVNVPSAEFDVILNFAEVGEALRLDAEFRLDCYTKERMTEMLDGLERVLAAAASDPSQPISRLRGAIRDGARPRALSTLRRRGVPLGGGDRARSIHDAV